MQVQKINNSQPFVKNKSNNNACETKSLHNVSFGAYGEELIQRLISKQGKRSPIRNLLRRPHINMGKLNLFKSGVEYFHEFSRARFYKPNIYIGSSFDSINVLTDYYMRCAKEAGIKTIIDLDEPSIKLKNCVENNGLKYYSYPIWTYALDNTRCSNEMLKDRLVDFIKEKDKKSIGWTPEFEKRFNEKLKLIK